MKINKLLSIAALALTITGCQMAQPEEPKAGELILEIGLPSASKTYMGPSAEGKRPLYWSNGDKLALNGVYSEALSGIAEGSSTAKFRFEGDFTAPYNVLYPHYFYSTESQIELPQVPRSLLPFPKAAPCGTSAPLWA